MKNELINNIVKVGLDIVFHYDIDDYIIQDRMDYYSFDNENEMVQYRTHLLGFKDWFNEHYSDGYVCLWDYVENSVRNELPDVLDDLFNRYETSNPHQYIFDEMVEDSEEN